jgi:hypothetical protein
VALWRERLQALFRSHLRLGPHRIRAHGVPPPLANIKCGAHPRGIYCIQAVCRGAALDGVVALLRQLELEHADIARQIARVRAERRLPALHDAPLVQPMPRFDHFLQHLLNACAEHDWPRPPPAPGVCCACLNSYDQHAFVRCGERLPLIDDDRADLADADADADPARAGFAGPNSAWSWRRPLVYCGRIYHTYCLMPLTTITSGDIWLAAHVRARDFCASLGEASRTSVGAQTANDHWRCSECALGVAVARPLSTPADKARRTVPLLDALRRAVQSGHASPHAHRALTTLLQIFTACPVNIASSLQAIGRLAPDAFVMQQQQQQQSADGGGDDDAVDNNSYTKIDILSVMKTELASMHGHESPTPLPRGGARRKRKEPPHST